MAFYIPRAWKNNENIMYLIENKYCCSDEFHNILKQVLSPK